MRIHKATIFLLFLLFIFSGACSKKEDASSEKKSVKLSGSAPETVFDDFLSAIDGSVVSMLPKRTYGFLLFLNTDGVARKQKEYWEKSLPDEIKERIDSSLSGFESILEEAGLLNGKKVSDVYTMESAQFISRAESVHSESDVQSENDEDHAGFITRLKLENLGSKAKEIADAVSKKGTPVKVIQSGELSVLEFEDKGAIIPAFRYLGLKDSYIVSASSKEVIEEVFLERQGKLPEIFSDREFISLAGKLEYLKKSVIFGGLKGAPETAFPFAFGMHQEAFGGGLLKQESDKSSSEEVLMAFNQSFESTYGAELRVKASEKIRKFLKSEDQEGTLTSSVKRRETIPQNTILSLELSELFTEKLLQENRDIILNYEPRLLSILSDVSSIGFFLSAVDTQRLLPVPAISFLLEVENKERVLEALKEIVKTALQSNSMVPPGADWIAMSDDTSTILTALGEEVSIISRGDATLAVTSSRDIVQMLLSPSASGTVPLVSLKKLFSAESGAKTDLGSLFINFSTLTKALDKVFAMSGAFGAQTDISSTEFSPELFIKALSAVGISGARIYLDGEEEMVVNVKTSNP